MTFEEQVKMRFAKVLEGLHPEKIYKPGDEKPVLRRIKAKLEKAKKAMAPATLLEEVKLMWEMLRDPDYQLEWDTKAWILFALAYFISPIDLIPDATPGIGYLDDMMVVAFVASRVRNDIDAYRKYTAIRSRL